MFMLTQSSPISSVSSRSSSVNSLAGASPLGSGTGEITTDSVSPAGFLGVEVASSDEIQYDRAFAIETPLATEAPLAYGPI